MPLTVLAVVSIVATACSGGGGTAKTASKSRVPSTSSTTVVVGKKVAEGTISEVAATTFDVPGTKIKVLIPLGSVSKDATVEVREVQGAPIDLGAVQVGSNVYDVAVKNGKINAGKQILVSFPVDATKVPTTDPQPVGGMYDEATGWQPTTSDPEDGAVTVYVTKPGKYSWLHWSWDKAVQTGTDTIRALVGPVAPQTTPLKCEDSEAVRAKFDVVGSTGSALTWCVGKDAGADVVRVLNNGEAPLAIRSKGFGTPKAPAGNILLDALAKALVSQWQKPVDEDVTVLTPGDEVDFPILDNGAKALLRAELNGFTQHFDALGAATAFATGFYAGSAATAIDLLEKDQTIRDAVIGQVTAQGCVNGLGAVTGNSWATKDVATYVGKLVLTCMDAKTTQLVTDAVAKRTAGLRNRFTKEPPVRTTDQIKPALLTALSPLVEPAGGSVAGQIEVAPRGAGSTSPAPTLSTVSTQPTVVVTVVPPSTTATTAGTVSPIAPTTTTLPGGATTTRPATTTTAAPVPTTPAPTTTTTVKPTTTTTVAPTTTTTVAPTTTTTAPPPPLPLVFSVIGTCGTNGGALSAVSANFVPGRIWNSLITAPANAGPPLTSAGTANADGSISWGFPCTGAAPGLWTVEINEVAPPGTLARPAVVTKFLVNALDTRVVDPTVNVEMCSATVAPGGGIVTAGHVLQTFVVPANAATNYVLTDVGVLNAGQAFTGDLALYRGLVKVWSAPVTAAAAVLNPVPVVAAVPSLAVTPGETLTLVVDNAVGANPLLPLTFRRTGASTIPTADLVIDNTCVTSPPFPTLATSGTELIGWVGGRLA